MDRMTLQFGSHRFTKDVVNQYNSVLNIHFTGLLSLDDLFTYYKKSGCLRLN